MSSNTNQAGKGDKPRPVDKVKYDENFDKIFKRKRELSKISVFKKGKTTYKY